MPCLTLELLLQPLMYDSCMLVLRMLRFSDEARQLLEFTTCKRCECKC